MNKRLTAHFTINEFTKSNVAEKYNIDNSVDEQYYPNVVALAEMLEKIRVKLGRPIYITSGYRCDRLNRLVGGVVNSEHRLGNAADIICYDNKKLFNLILEMMKSGEIVCSQVISENGLSWIHIGRYTDGSSHRNQVLYR